ncbi:MAG: sugar phosphate isomerase/epimerase [Alphaproteobacteria bacterium]|nr:MAG: sugar phosphate isomerase/epimerase [Alphaproteobacteria bacterium]
MKRRDFLKLLAGTTIVGAAAPSFLGAAASDAKVPVGIQLYTVRWQMEENMPGTLEALAGLGYGEVEFAGYFEHSPAEVKKMLADAGLAAPSTHLPIEMFENNLDQVIEFAHGVGHKYLVMPWLREDQRTADIFKSVAETLNKAGEKAKSAGLAVAYHNHDFEFDALDGTTPYEILLANTDPDLVKLELDLFWLNVAGVDLLSIIDRFPGRVPLAHVKDRTKDGAMTDVGSGIIDFGRVFAQAEKAGLKHYIVEHDQPEDPMQTAANSVKYLKKTFPRFGA